MVCQWEWPRQAWRAVWISIPGGAPPCEPPVGVCVPLVHPRAGSSRSAFPGARTSAPARPPAPQSILHVVCSPGVGPGFGQVTISPWAPGPCSVGHRCPKCSGCVCRSCVWASCLLRGSLSLALARRVRSRGRSVSWRWSAPSPRCACSHPFAFPCILASGIGLRSQLGPSCCFELPVLTHSGTRPSV